MKNKNVRYANILFLIEVLCIMLGFSLLVTLMSVVCKPLIAVGLVRKGIVELFVKLVSENQIIAMIISQTLLFIPIMVLYINKKKLLHKTVRMKPINGITVVLLVVLTYTLLPLMSFINMISMMFVKNKIANTINNVVENEEIIIGIIVIGMLPAFVEEFLCRGIIYNLHAKVSVRRAILLNGIIFGLLHCNFNQFAYAFFMGIVFSLVVEATDSTLSTILMHFIINSSSLVMSYVSKRTGQKISFDDATKFTLTEVISWTNFELVALVLSILIYVLIAKVNKRYDYIKKELNIRKNKEDKESVHEEKKEDIIDIYLVISFIICVFYMIAVEI